MCGFNAEIPMLAMVNFLLQSLQYALCLSVDAGNQSLKSLTKSHEELKTHFRLDILLLRQHSHRNQGSSQQSSPHIPMVDGHVHNVLQSPGAYQMHKLLRLF